MLINKKIELNFNVLTAIVNEKKLFKMGGSGGTYHCGSHTVLIRAIVESKLRIAAEKE